MEGERKMLDIDVLLAKGHLALRLGGKEYIVDDVPIEVFLEATNISDADKNPDTLRNQLAKILGADSEALKGIGIRGISYALLEIKKWMTEPLDDMIPSGPKVIT